MATEKKITNKEEVRPKVLNAFESFLAARKVAEAGDKSEKINAPAKKSIRNESITKVCATCGKEYHPTRNGYSLVSKYCSQKCTMNGVRGKLI